MTATDQTPIQKAQEVIQAVRQLIITEEYKGAEVPKSYEQADGGCNHGEYLSFAFVNPKGRIILLIQGMGLFRAEVDKVRIQVEKDARDAKYIAEREALWADIAMGLYKQTGKTYRVISTGNRLDRTILQTHKGATGLFKVGDFEYQLFIPRTDQSLVHRLACTSGYSYQVELC